MFISLTGCASQGTKCVVYLGQASSDFFPKVENQNGDQFLFTIEYKGKNCTDLKINQEAHKIFEKYAKEHNYVSFRVIETNPGKVASKRYVVLFK